MLIGRLHANQSQAAQIVVIELLSYCQQVIEWIYSLPKSVGINKQS